MSNDTEENFELDVEFLQPWSTFVLKTTLPPPVLEEMIKISDEIVENRESATNVGHQLAGQIEDEFLIEFQLLSSTIKGFLSNMCRTYIEQAYSQHSPFNKEEFLKEKKSIEVTGMWVVSQKDNEYNPIHIHSGLLSSVMYLKIPEYLPARKSNRTNEDGIITFTNNSSTDKHWGDPHLRVIPKVGDFFIFPATQSHQVYPFRTADGKGERRSVSFNVDYSK
jgi:uncharacterized protein (TIGR02466 family)